MIAVNLEKTTARTRFEGFLKAMNDAGLPIEDKWVVEGDFEPEDGYECMNNLFRLEELPTAIFCFNDVMALGAISAITERGLSVPNDISIIGYDNIHNSRFYAPPLTTVHQSKSRLGTKALDLLLERIKKEETAALPQTLEFHPELVKRHSVKNINKYGKAMEFLISFFSSYGYWAVFLVLIACGFGVPIPEDITLVSGGVISGLGYTNVHWMLVVSMLGVLIGDSTMYWLGRIYGKKIRHFPLIRNIITEDRYKMVQERFEKQGNRLLFLARFLPGLRAVVYLVSGITRRISFTRFLLVDFCAAIISVPVWVYLGDYGAQQLDWLKEQVEHGQHTIFAVLGLVAIYFAFKWFKGQKKQ